MNRFLLLALTAGLLSPIAAKAEKYWLLVNGWEVGTTKIEMQSMEDCETTRKKWFEEIVKKKRNIQNMFCVKGK